MEDRAGENKRRIYRSSKLLSHLRDTVEHTHTTGNSHWAISRLVLQNCAKVGGGSRRACKLASDVALKLHGYENNFAVRRFGHLLEGLQLPDLHGRGRGENVGSLPHETGSINFCASSNDLGLSNTLLLCGGRERRGDLGAENDIFDKDPLNSNTPLIRDVANDLGNFESNGLAFSDDALDSTGTNDMTKGGLGTFDESLSKVRDPECCAVGVAYLEIDHRVTGARSCELDSGNRRETTLHFDIDVVTRAEIGYD